MDFLSIRKKARERAEAKETAQPGEKAAAEALPAPGSSAEPPPPAPSVRDAPVSDPAREGRGPGEGRHVRKPDRVLSDADLLEGALQARFQGLSPSSDGRFATWRPGSGAAPVELDPLAWGPPADPRRPPPEPGSEHPQGNDPGYEPDPDLSLSVYPPPETRLVEDPLDAFFYRPDEEAAAVPALGGNLEEQLHPLHEILDEFLTFQLGKEEFAVPIERVREVLRAPAITEVPRAPAHVLGVVTVRGEVVAVVDIRGRLGLAGDGGSVSARIVIVDAGDGNLGLLVDAVTNVVRLPRGSIEPCPQGVSAGAAECVTGIGRHRDRLFMVIDTGALLPRSGPAER